MTDVAVGCADGNVRVYDAASLTPRHLLRGHASDVYALRYFPSGKVLLSGGADMHLRIWDAVEGYEALSLTGHRGAIQRVAFFGRGRQVASASLDGTARVWDCPSAACLLSLTASDAGPVHDVHVQAGSGGHVVATAGEDGSVRLWDVRLLGAGAAVATSNGSAAAGVATGAGETSATPRSLSSGREPSADAANACVCAGDGRLLVAGFDSGAVRVWDTRQTSSAPLCEAQVSDAPVHRLERGYDRESVIVGCGDGTVTERDARSQRPTRVLSGAGAFSVRDVARAGADVAEVEGRPFRTAVVAADACVRLYP